MNRLHLAAISAALVSACTSAQTGVVRTDALLQGGTEANATIQLPDGWYQSSKKADRVDFVGPDNFSRASLSSSAVTAAPSSCPALARRAAEQTIASLGLPAGAAVQMSPGTEKPREPDFVEFSTTLPGSPPGPTDRQFFGLSLCRNGAVATATCSSGVLRAEMAQACRNIVRSLAIEPTTALAGPRPTGTGVLVPRPGTAPTMEPGREPGSEINPSGEQRTPPTPQTTP